ncbi:hypothetical protein [Synechococcus elongatus]|uniref:hypothetical protein n=1 Tax=Synechococcus elongatus TaxID=32046 RepID=UPI000F7D6665|nr:hypothetical protein [Synechococcus elongatus]
MEETTPRLNARAIAIVSQWSHPLNAKDLRYRQFQNRVYVHSYAEYTHYWAGGPHRFALIRQRSLGKPVQQLILRCPKEYVRPYKALKSDATSELLVEPDEGVMEHWVHKTNGLSTALAYDWDDRVDTEGEWLDPVPFIRRLREPKLLCADQKAAFQWEYLTQIADTGDELVGYKILDSPHKAIRITGDYEAGYIIDWGDLSTAFAILAPLKPTGTTAGADWARRF